MKMPRAELHLRGEAAGNDAPGGRSKPASPGWRRVGASAVIAGALIAGAWPAAPSASAAVSSTTGAAQAVSAPPSVAVGSYESSTNIRVFTEARLTLAAPLTMWTIATNGTTTMTSLAAGTCVQSHMIHDDGVGAASPTLSGTATFTQNIIGVIPVNTQLLGRPLDATDALLGASGTAYPAPGNNGRGAELLLSVDSLSFSLATPARLGFTFGGDGFDEVRVLTGCDAPPADVPESALPVLMPIVAAGTLCGLQLVRRRRLAAQ